MDIYAKEAAEYKELATDLATVLARIEWGLRMMDEIPKSIARLDMEFAAKLLERAEEELN